MKYSTHKSKDDFYRSKAKYFKGLAKMKRITACVHLEGDSDKHFWKYIFHKYYPKGKFFFLSYSKLETKNKISGVEHCLRYVPYLSGNFFICIDSDYRYLTKIRKVEVENFILQTYTYSIENHYCYSKHLNNVCYKYSGIENNLFDFDKFYKDYSKIIYELFIWHIVILANGLRGITKMKFNEILTNFPRISIKNNGELMLSNLKTRVQKKINTLKDKHPDIIISDYFKYYSKMGLRPYNTYLYVRGHNIYDFTIKLGTTCGKALREIKKAQYDGNDIDEYFKSLPSFENALLESLANSSYMHLSKIEKDVEYYIKFLKEIR